MQLSYSDGCVYNYYGCLSIYYHNFKFFHLNEDTHTYVYIYIYTYVVVWMIVYSENFCNLLPGRGGDGHEVVVVIEESET